MAEKKLVISSKKYTGETAVVSARLPLDLIKKSRSETHTNGG